MRHEPSRGSTNSSCSSRASLTCGNCTRSSGGLELRTGGQLHLRASVCQVSVRPSAKTPHGIAAGPPLMLAEYLLHWLLRPAAGML